MQQCVCLSIKQKKDKNYQSVYKEKLVKIIQSLMPRDENITIVKNSEHMIKVQDKFIFLEDDALTKDTQLPKSLLKNMHFFH